MALRRDVHSADTLMSGLGQLLRSASCDDLETLKKVAEESNRQVLFKVDFLCGACVSINIDRIIQLHAASVRHQHRNRGCQDRARHRESARTGAVGPAVGASAWAWLVC